MSHRRSVCRRIAAMLSACLLLVAAASAYSYPAESPDEIKSEIYAASIQRDAAHDLAEAARVLGEDEDHHTIVYAQERWQELDDSIRDLSERYDAVVSAEQERESRGKLLGRFRITFYCPCARCNGSSDQPTKSGAPLTIGETIAVDPSVIPLGSAVYIDGIGERIAQDTGGAIKGNRIDVLVSTHEEAETLGVQYADVYIS